MVNKDKPIHITPHKVAFPTNPVGNYIVKSVADSFLLSPYIIGDGYTNRINGWYMNNISETYIPSELLSQQHYRYFRDNGEVFVIEPPNGITPLEMSCYIKAVKKLYP